MILANVGKRRNALMDHEFSLLSDLKPSQRATIAYVDNSSATVQRLLEMGVTPGVSVEMMRDAPLGDPMEFRIGDSHLLLRKQEAALIKVCHVS
jgi:Fe2+ transport system protein FeoA